MNGEDALVHVPSREQLLATAQALPAVRVFLEGLADLGPDPPRIALVGGAVRDLLLGLRSADVDLVVEGPLSIIEPLLDARAQSYDRFTTLTLETEAGRIDVAQARRERYPYPGALPEVEPATLEQDLERRDFTVNALAVSLMGTSAGELLSHQAALEDLEHRRLAVLHDDSFIDDPTRLLRLARYRSRLRFDIAPHTLELARAAVNDGALGTVSGQRVGSELRLLVDEPDPAAALAALSEFGADRAIAPGFGLGGRGDTRSQTLNSALTQLPPDGRPDLLAMAVACEQVAPGTRRSLLDHLGFPASDRDVILDAAGNAAVLAGALGNVARPSEIANALVGSAVEAIVLAGAIGDETAGANAARWLTDLRDIHPAITGDDLLAEGVPSGPAVGAGLAAARARLLDGAAPDRESQLRVALDVARRQLG